MPPERPYQAHLPPPEPPKFLIVEGPGMTAERAEAESGETPAAKSQALTETPAGDTQLE